MREDLAAGPYSAVCDAMCVGAAKPLGLSNLGTTGGFFGGCQTVVTPFSLDISKFKSPPPPSVLTGVNSAATVATVFGSFV